MILTTDNYFSLEANKKYMSNSQFKEFVECESRAMARISGEYVQEEETYFLVGKYVHAWNEGTLEDFQKNNPQVFTLKGELRAEFKGAELIIQAIQDDALLMEALSGQKEQIFTAEMFGCEWKIVIDSLFLKEKRFADLKILKELRGKEWDEASGSYMSVYEYRGYFVQMAVYAAILRRALKVDEYYEPFIIALTKQAGYPNKAIFSFVSNEESLDEFIVTQLAFVENKMPRILAVKKGEIEPLRCEECIHCRKTKKLKGTIHYSSLLLNGAY